MIDQVEFVARAFHAAEDPPDAWDCEPEAIKEQYRRYAREAISLLAQEQGYSSLETIELSHAA